MSWKISQNRKVHQRAINKLMRNINQNIYNDPLWKGRYYIRQYKCWWSRDWEDPTYYRFIVQFILYDRKTNLNYLTCLRTSNDWLFLNGYKLWREMNDFILDSRVWEENPRPTYENTPDFRNNII